MEGMMKKCKECGVEYHDAHVTYDGHTIPYITKKCGKYVEKCKDPDCWTCCLHGGHNFIKNGNGRHKWKNEGSGDE